MTQALSKHNYELRITNYELHNHRELLKESAVAVVEQTDISNAVLHHRQARQTNAERKSAVFFRVDAAKAQNVGMNQTAGN